MTTKKRNREIAADLVRRGRGFVLIVHDGVELRMFGDVSRMWGRDMRERAMEVIWGETVAGPTFKVVMEETLRYLNVKPDVIQ